MAGSGSRLGEATVIGGATAAAYLCALAYRVGQTARLGFPITISAVRLSDAAFAGLFVLVGGVLVLLLVDLLESWRPGALSRTWITLMLVTAVVVVVALVSVVLATLVILVQLLGLPVTLLVAVAVVVAAAAFVLRALPRLVSADPKMEAFETLLRRHPVPTLSVVLSVFLCLASLALGWAGTAWPHAGYPRTRLTNEVAVAIYDDRVVLAEIQSSAASLDATLTGGFRVVPLPSDDVSFSAGAVRRLHRETP